jgi:uncharacterized protein YhaN
MLTPQQIDKKLQLIETMLDNIETMSVTTKGELDKLRKGLAVKPKVDNNAALNSAISHMLAKREKNKKRKKNPL